jgi:hypothetical protein
MARRSVRSRFHRHWLIIDWPIEHVRKSFDGIDGEGTNR